MVVGSELKPCRDRLELAREELLATVLANAPIVLFAFGADGEILLSEGRALERFGLRDGGHVGQNLRDHWGKNPEVLEHFGRALAGEELTVHGRVGGQWETRYSPLRDANGGIIGVVGVATDVTDLEQASGELQEFRRRTHELYVGSVHALAAALEAKDSGTFGDSRHVATVARLIAIELGLGRDDLERVELAAVLHDVGKIGLPDSILRKPGPLTPEERVRVTEHPTIGGSILERSDALRDLAPLVRHHHEFFDGSGYPDGLAGEDIPLGSRIIAVVDAFNAMVSPRSYKQPFDARFALDQIARNRGRQFAPEVVDAFVRVWEREGRSLVMEIQRVPLDERPRARTIADELRGDAERQTRLLRFHLQLGKALTLVPDPPAMAHELARMTAETLGFERAAIVVRDEKAAVLAGMWPANGERACAAGCAWHDGRGSGRLGPEEGRCALLRPAGWSDGVHVPLVTAEGARLGALAIGTRHGEELGSADEEMLASVASEIAVALSVARTHRRLEEAAYLDPLTRVLNHRAFFSRFEEELERASRSGGRFALVSWDLDALKSVNDTLGHPAGDAALVAFVDVLRAESRPYDVIGRIGGDEFATIIPDADHEIAHRHGARVLDRALRTSFGEGSPLPLPSRGFAIYPDDTDDREALVRLADERMYGNKRGKNWLLPVLRARREAAG